MFFDFFFQLREPVPCPGGAVACAHFRMPQLILAARPAMSQRQGAVSDEETFLFKKKYIYHFIALICHSIMLLTDSHGYRTFY